MSEDLKMEYLPATSQWAQKLLLAACELAAPIETTLTNQPQTELQPYTEAEIAEMTFAFRIRLNCEVEQIYAHAMGVKL
ncbi:MAG TPA: hypothetical protein VF783_02495 [Terriglobales bacterium]